MNRENKAIILGVFIILLILVVVGLLWLVKANQITSAPSQNTSASSTDVTMSFDQSISNGPIMFSYPSATFGLATTQDQVLVRSYIPPCDPDFDYCLYYHGTEYQGTNFESAGLRIKKRTDLANERICLQTPPAGFDASMMPAATSSSDTYSASEFTPIGDAGAGHYASGSLYRLFYRADSSCYEFETRIGETQYANYPAGSIKEFTATDQAAVQSKLNQILEKISLPNGNNNLFAF